MIETLFLLLAINWRFGLFILMVMALLPRVTSWSSVPGTTGPSICSGSTTSLMTAWVVIALPVR